MKRSGGSRSPTCPGTGPLLGSSQLQTRISPARRPAQRPFPRGLAPLLVGERRGAAPPRQRPLQLLGRRGSAHRPERRRQRPGGSRRAGGAGRRQGRLAPLLRRQRRARRQQGGKRGRPRRSRGGGLRGGDRRACSGRCNLYLWEAGGRRRARSASSRGSTRAGTGSKATRATGCRRLQSAIFLLSTQKTAELSADGRALLFLSQEKLSSYDNEGTPELYLYRSGQGISCVSCNPTGAPPTGSPRWARSSPRPCGPPSPPPPNRATSTRKARGSSLRPPTRSPPKTATAKKAVNRWAPPCSASPPVSTSMSGRRPAPAAARSAPPPTAPRAKAAST